MSAPVDGRTLIPGDPRALTEISRGLTSYGEKLTGVGDALKRVNSDAWTGAAGDAFRAKFDQHRPVWFTAGDAFRSAAGAVSRYAETLRWAQGRAGEIAGRHAQAVAASQAAVAAYNDNAARGVAQAPFVDPGLENQRQADEELADVRGQVQRAGGDAARAVGAATQTAPAEGLWAQAGNWIEQAGRETGAVLSAFGQSALDNPEAVVAAGLGAGAILAGLGGTLGGGAVSLSGVGAVVGVPAVAASVGLIAGGATAIGAATYEMARDAKDNYRRPSGFRKGVRDTVFDRNKGADGKVRDPKTGEEIKKDSKWDMGHKPGQEFRKHQESARQREIDRKQFLDEHNNPGKYRPETQNTNRSRKMEDKTDQYGGD